MILNNDFYHIEKILDTENGFCVDVVLNKDHFIYSSHFPGNPVTPGACIVQMVDEMMKIKSEKPLYISKIPNIKFLSIISPVETPKVTFSFSIVSQTEDSCKIQVVVSDSENRFANMSIIYSYECR